MEQTKSQVAYADAVSSGILDYIPMPEALKGKYQSYTEADIHALRATGYESTFDDVNEGVSRYVRHLWHEYQGAQQSTKQN